MPFKYKIIESKKLLYAEATGTVTYDDLVNHIDELCQDPGYKAPMKKLVDYRRIKKMDISMDQQKRFAEKKDAVNSLFSDEKCAIVAPTDFGFALARIHASLSERADRNTAAFRNFNEALIWLGVELDNPELISD